MSKDAKKSVDKKFLMVPVAIILVLILIILIVALSRSCSKPSDDYENTQKKLLSGAKSYYASHSDELPAVNESIEIDASTLAENGNMNGLSSYLKDTSCTGKVNVYNNGGQYLYIPDLQCAEYKTKHLSDKIIEDNLVSDSAINEPVTSENGSIVSTGKDYISGLYNENGIYVFKGKNPNNYFSFGNLVWRILDISEDGTIRLLKVEQEKRHYYWDTKYNADVKRSYGINDYKNSLIVEKMNSDYNAFKDESKLHLAPYSVCVSKRGSEDISKDRSIDCSEVLENQYVGLVNISDFARGSLDENCNNITDGACSNYNYLSTILIHSWTSTASTENTYNAYYINGGIASLDEVRKSMPYNWVISIKGAELYVSGDGTEKKPYTIK